MRFVTVALKADWLNLRTQHSGDPSPTAAGLCMPICLCVGLDSELGDGVEDKVLRIRKCHFHEDSQNFLPSLT